MRRAVGLLMEMLERMRPAVLIALISLASYAIPVDISFFYLVPIALTAWFVGRRAGTLFSVLGAGAWVVESLLGDRFGKPGSVVIYIDGVLLLGFFLLFSGLLSALRAALGREKEGARIDALTQIFNRRAFSELAEAEIQRAARYGGHFTVAYLDLDDFKQVNDRFGHVTGDRVLALTAQAIHGQARGRADVFCESEGEGPVGEASDRRVSPGHPGHPAEAA